MAKENMKVWVRLYYGAVRSDLERSGIAKNESGAAEPRIRKDEWMKKGSKQLAARYC
jgi:hypothetical protein